MDKSVEWTELFVNDRATTPMTPQIVLRWSNNARGSENGMTVLYLADGRPEAVCCVFPWEKTLAHEFDSLLPQPLYRYESKRNDLLDGAVFAFVQGTDPESLLLLEAFKEGNRYEWQFAFARRTSGELEGRHQEAVVWHADRYPRSDDPRSIHITLTRPIKPGVLDEILQTK